MSLSLSSFRSEFWLGLKKMHQLTQSGSWHLKVEVKFDVNRYGKLAPRHGKWGMGEWNNFKVASESQGFKLTIGRQKVKQQNLGGGDVWHYSRNRQFSTADRGPSSRCATRDGGGWWHSNCYWFCGNCQRSKTLGRHMLWYDTFGNGPKQVWDFPSITKMWIKKVN